MQYIYLHLSANISDYYTKDSIKTAIVAQKKVA